MKRNLSNVDRVVRVLLAAVFAYLYWSGVVGGAPGIILVVLGAIFLFTSVMGFCPLYRAFNLSTYRA